MLGSPKGSPTFSLKHSLEQPGETNVGFIDYKGDFHDNICWSACDICVGCHAVVWRPIDRRNDRSVYKKACQCPYKYRSPHMVQFVRSRKRVGDTYLVHNPLLGDDFSWLENEK